MHKCIIQTYNYIYIFILLIYNLNKYILFSFSLIIINYVLYLINKLEYFLKIHHK